MTASMLASLTEDELNTLVSNAIRRAELLEDEHSPVAGEAWREVMTYEVRLADLTSPADIPGGVARAGAVHAALAAGDRREAKRLAARYLDEERLPEERRAAIQRVLDEEDARLARKFPALARSGLLRELDEWRTRAQGTTRIFPPAA